MAPVETKKRKRGRPSKAEIAARLNENSQVDGEAPHKKRSRPSNAETALHLNDSSRVDGQPPATKKRGRPPGTANATRLNRKQRENEQSPHVERDPPPDIDVVARPDDKTQEDEQSPSRKHDGPPAVESITRPGYKNGEDEPSPHHKSGQPPRTEGTSLMGDKNGEHEQSHQVRGQPSGTETAAHLGDEGRESEQLPRRKRGRPSGAEIAARLKDASTVNKLQSKPSTQKKRGSSMSREDPKSRKPSETANDPSMGQNEATYYQHIAPIVRGVPRHTIDSKWAPLPPNAIGRIWALLNEVERSVVMRLRDDHKRTQASTAIKMVSRRLHRKLSRGQPFPPGTRPQPEEDFDFEKILDSSNALEAKLTPMLHSIGLLKAVAKKEEALLEAETTALEVLESNAKVHESQKYNTTRKLHALSRDVGDSIDSDGFINGRNQQKVIDAVSSDENLRPILDQLRHHLENMQSNVSQVEGLAPAMGNIKATIQDILIKHVDREDYDRLILG